MGKPTCEIKSTMFIKTIEAKPSHHFFIASKYQREQGIK